MKRQIFIALMMGLIPVSAFVQNLVPNPGFESTLVCPTGISQFVGRVANWTGSNSASPDYAACGVNGNVAIRNYPATGNASAGMWGGASHPSCASSAYSEAVQVGLSSSLSNGATYDVSFSVQVDAVGSATSAPNNCVDFGMYLFNSASPPPNGGWCCLPVTPQFSVPGGAVLQGTYTTFSSTIVASGAPNTIVVGPFCNGNTSGSGCSNYTGTRMYFNLDDVVVQPATVLDPEHFEARGEIFLRQNKLTWDFELPIHVDAFKIERSTDQQIFQQIGTWTAPTGTHPAREFTDEAPEPGTNYYRITAITPGGEMMHSNIVELRSAAKPKPQDPGYQYGYDEKNEILNLFPLQENLPGMKATIVDLKGQTVLEKSWMEEEIENQISLAVSQLPAGLYVLKVQSGDGSILGMNKWVKY